VVRSIGEDGFSGWWLHEVVIGFSADRLQEIMMFLQALPTRDWTEKDIELLLSEAFIWQSLFQDSSAHLRQTESPASTPDAVLR
jgi:hypothetical protein